jgi:hypothetical protein
MVTKKEKERLKIQAMYVLDEERKLGLTTKKEFWAKTKEQFKKIEEM